VKHETDEDLEREARIAGIVERAWDVRMEKMPDPWNLDYVLYRDDAVCGFLEIRHRNMSSMDHPTFMMSAHKADSARLFGDLGIPVSMVVKMTDGLFIFDPRYPDFTKHGGRNVMRDPADQGLMAHFYMSRLKHFSRDAMLTYTMPHSPLRAKGHAISRP
jgi:hypothetical protein